MDFKSVNNLWLKTCRPGSINSPTQESQKLRITESLGTVKYHRLKALLTKTLMDERRFYLGN